MSIFAKFFDRKLRKELVEKAGFSLEDILYVKRYIDGDDNALRELIAFRDEREKITYDNFKDRYTTKYTTTDNTVNRTASSAPYTRLDD